MNYNEDLNLRTCPPPSQSVSQSVDNTLGLCASTMEEICSYSRQLLVRLRAKCVARIEEFPLYVCVFVG